MAGGGGGEGHGGHDDDVRILLISVGWLYFNYEIQPPRLKLTFQTKTLNNFICFGFLENLENLEDLLRIL